MTISTGFSARFCAMVGIASGLFAILLSTFTMAGVESFQDGYSLFSDIIYWACVVAFAFLALVLALIMVAAFALAAKAARSWNGRVTLVISTMEPWRLYDRI